MRIAPRSVEQLKAVLVRRRDEVWLILGAAVHQVIRSKRAIVASKARLATMRPNCADQPSIDRRNVR